MTSHSIPIKFANFNGSKSPVKSGLNLVQPRRTLGDITPKKDKNILPPEPINNHLNIPQSPVKSLKPKKRWIKTVVQEQKRQESPVIGNYRIIHSILAPVTSKPKTKSGNMLPSIDILK